MDWQQIISLGIVGTAAAVLLGSRFRRRKFNLQRDTHCGCATSSARPGTMVFRARRGERPEITVKMK